MTRIAPIDLVTAPEQVRSTLSAVKAQVGMVPNLYATFAQSPATLDGFLAFNGALAKGSLTARQREIVALAVAQANGCHYCLSAHSYLGKHAGLSPEEIRDAREGRGAASADNAIASFASRVVETRGQIATADIATARDAGLNDGQLIEVIAHVALNILTNYTNNVAQTEIDFPEVELELTAAA